MQTSQKPFERRPVYHEDDDHLLGYVAKDATSWQAQTIFGYIIARTTTEQEAEKALFEMGRTYLKGVWQYYDKDDHDWFPCVIKDAYEHKVTVIRTNFLGYQEPEVFKLVILENPDENTLIKSS